MIKIMGIFFNKFKSLKFKKLKNYWQGAFLISSIFFIVALAQRISF